MLPAVAQAIREMLAPAAVDRFTIRKVCETTDPRTVWTPALELIANALEDTFNTPDGRLIISMPPQEGKSTTASINFPIWALMRNPDLRIITGSYGQSLANRNGRAVRNHIKAHPEFGLTIAADNGAAAEWQVSTPHRGGLIAVGRGAGVTGRPADLMLIDDPVKDRQEADSQVVRDTCMDWWRDALSARLAPGAPCIVIATRWHEADMSGQLAETGDWRVLNIPAECEDPATDPLGRPAGEFMISARGRTRAQWEARKRTAGSRTWAALYQGHPAPADGDLFKRSWFTTAEYPHPVAVTNPDGTRTVPNMPQLLTSWDMTFKDTKASDFVVGQVWGKRGADAWLLDQVRGRFTFTDTLAQVKALAARWPQASVHLVEDKANGSAVIDQLRHTIPGIIAVTPKESKQARAAAVTPYLEAGNVHVPAAALAPWVGDLVEEAAGFPNAAHDDQVDALSQALARLFLTGTAGGFLAQLVPPCPKCGTPVPRSANGVCPACGPEQHPLNLTA